MSKYRRKQRQRFKAKFVCRCLIGSDDVKKDEREMMKSRPSSGWC